MRNRSKFCRASRFTQCGSRHRGTNRGRQLQAEKQAARRHHNAPAISISQQGNELRRRNIDGAYARRRAAQNNSGWVSFKLPISANLGQFQSAVDTGPPRIPALCIRLVSFFSFIGSPFGRRQCAGESWHDGRGGRWRRQLIAARKPSRSPRYSPRANPLHCDLL